MFDCVSSFPFAVMVRCVRATMSVLPHILDDIVMHVIAKGDIFQFIGHGYTNTGIVLCESRQYWFEFVAM